ncbi:hypothetical protein PPERSA_00498 [Pseudocohnilembus persalinus]|uniref:Poly(A) RNA polymerase mitochondrial-like central palm domain-containing protein n=1 Tax=Pseudocohnilembus persalinus TaxID=266149 RepID=A0A0V0R941_PSEPJ|nr:hypothetical protein PPERSA_00498 [Pseudocohnilembus persalinus]|eukprot:KRX10728.1 hypothetical protein PPERSA_00498 [Pseudocohnilembus persalinus]
MSQKMNKIYEQIGVTKGGQQNDFLPSTIENQAENYVQNNNQNEEVKNKQDEIINQKRSNPYENDENESQQNVQKQVKIDENQENDQNQNELQQKEQKEKQEEEQQQEEYSDDDNAFIQFEQEEEPEKKEEEDIPERKIAPWISKKTLRIQNSVLRLHNEIIEFTQYLQPTKAEHQLRMDSFNRLCGLIHEVLPDCDIKPFGSFTTQLYLPNADIDFCIVNESMENRQMYVKVAKLLQSRTDIYENINLITNAKVPIIKFVETSTQINYDISFNKLDGVKQLDEVQKTLKVYPEMKYLIFILKCMLRQRDLHETFKGGIGSFLLFCMILAFLRETRKQYISEKRIDEIKDISLGEYILKFFEFYGMKNDWSTKRIIMAEGGAVIDKQYDNSFSLISPQDSEHDIGASSFKIRDIFNVFKNRFYFMTNFNFKEKESILKYLVNPSGGEFIFSKDDKEEQN